MAGVTCMVGEDAKSKDPNLKLENGKITEFPLMQEILSCFARYDRGFGQIVPQCNVEDDMLGVPEMVLRYGGKALEFKFGQSAKGTQPVNRLPDIDAALAKVRETGNLPVPLPLRNAPTQLMKDLDYSDGYKYAHDFPGHFADMEFLPDALRGTVFYDPQPNRHENTLRAYLEACWPIRAITFVPS